jgi:hypothetical protein
MIFVAVLNVNVAGLLLDVIILLDLMVLPFDISWLGYVVADAIAGSHVRWTAT